MSTLTPSSKRQTENPLFIKPPPRISDPGSLSGAGIWPPLKLPGSEILKNEHPLRGSVGGMVGPTHQKSPEMGLLQSGHEFVLIIFSGLTKKLFFSSSKKIHKKNDGKSENVENTQHQFFQNV